MILELCKFEYLWLFGCFKLHRHRADFQRRVRAVALSDFVPFHLDDDFEDAFINQVSALRKQ